MDKKNCHAFKGLKKIHELLDFEVLMSRPGISEPDSRFIWASTFMAPESAVFIDGQMFLNLFLPEGSENDPEKKIFLNRVGAKFQDGLWQVRRRMDQLKGQYGGPMQTAMSVFKTAIVDQMYIRKGRNYGRLLINHSELEFYSRILLRVQKERPDFRIEYYRPFDGRDSAFLIPGMEEELVFVTLEFHKNTQPDPTVSGEDEFFFTLANFVEGGVKAVALSKYSNVPEILASVEVSSPTENVFTFKSNNEFILSLVRALANQYVVILGYYGTINRENATLTVAMPREQIQIFMRTLAEVANEAHECNPIITEVVSLKDFQD